MDGRELARNENYGYGTIDQIVLYHEMRKNANAIIQAQMDQAWIDMRMQYWASQGHDPQQAWDSAQHEYATVLRERRAAKRAEIVSTARGLLYLFIAFVAVLAVLYGVQTLRYALL